MSLVTVIYLVSVFGVLNIVAHSIQVVMGLSLAAYAIFIIGYIDEEGAENGKELVLSYKTYYKKAIGLLVITLIINIFVPSKTEMYSMLAINQASELKLDETAKKGIEVLNIKLDEIIADSKKD